MTILITGGAGFLGCHTVQALLDAGQKVVVVDNFCNSSRDMLRRVHESAGGVLGVHDLDVRDRGGLAGVFAAEGIDAVIHLAALKAVGDSVDHPLDYYANNLGALLALLEVMNAHRCHRLVFSSSAAVYGTGSGAPFPESAPLHATNPYGRTKLFAEEILRDIAASDEQWRIVLLRYFNPVSAHPKGHIGENPCNVPTNLFPYIARVAMGRAPELLVFGDDYPTPDGTCIRDFIHIADLADGHLAALALLDRVAGVEAINLGSGQGHSVLDVVKIYEAVSGCPVPYRIVGRRPGDVAVSVANPAKAASVMNWKATRGLAAMCSDDRRWQLRSASGFST